MAGNDPPIPEVSLGGCSCQSFFRVRWLLRPAQRVTIPPQPAAMFYALICDAVAAQANGTPAMPEGVLLAAPDQGQIVASPGRMLSLAATILDDNEASAAGRIQRLHDGLAKLGRHPAKAQRLKKFEVLDPLDLVSGRTLRPGQQPTAVSVASLDEQFTRLTSLSSITLRFDAPLAAKRPKSQQREGHACFDQEYFSAPLFIKRLEDRLSDLGWQLPASSDEPRPARAEPIDLVWMDVGYRGKKAMTLGGVVGRVRFHHVSSRDLMLLVLGQFVHAGENTRFGFGRYAIEEVLDDSSVSSYISLPRSASLLEAAFSPNNLDVVDIELLKSRLRAYLPDKRLLTLMDQWLTLDATDSRRRGLPTGSPLSPVLANLLLDQFDERIAAQGGRLIRYSDDFLILCRDEAQARSMCRIAANEAEQLRLELNRTKSYVAAPGETFQFVGYRFRLGDQWQVDGDESAILIEDLGTCHPY